MSESNDSYFLEKAKETALIGSLCLGFSGVIFFFNRDASSWQNFLLSERGIIGTELLLCAMFSFFLAAGFYCNNDEESSVNELDSPDFERSNGQ
jgi:hypothetical protein